MFSSMLFRSLVHCAPSPHPTTHFLPVLLSSFCLSVACTCVRASVCVPAISSFLFLSCISYASVCLCPIRLRTGFSFIVPLLNLLHTRALSSDASGWTCTAPDIPSSPCCGRYRDNQLPRWSNSFPRSVCCRVLVSPHPDDS